jgi:hypothetical protein
MNKKPLLSIVFLLFIFSWVLPNTSYAQLDSTVATISVVENYYQATDSLDERDMAVLTIMFDDIADVGYVGIVVIDTETNGTVTEVSMSRHEWEIEGYFFSDRMELPLFEFSANHSYHIQIIPMNQLGAFTKMCELDLF